jgi:hypothetical protein
LAAHSAQAAKRLDHAQSIDLLGALPLQSRPLVVRFPQTAAQQNTGTGIEADYTFNVENPLSQDSDFVTGLQPGDIIKYSALPWQTDFNECTTNPNDVTYADWNVTYPDSENDADLRKGTKIWTTMWWPAHQPLQYAAVRTMGKNDPTYVWTTWAKGVPQTDAGDLKMVTEWAKLGFIIRNPFLPSSVYDTRQLAPITFTSRSSHSSASRPQKHQAATTKKRAMSDNPFLGNWTYRSFLNDPDINKSFNDLEFGVGTIVIEEAPMQTLKGTIGGSGWSLVLKGARQYGNPMHARFQGVGIVNGEKWVYDYEGYLVSQWPNGVDQIPAIIGSVVRTIPHSGSQPGTISPAGVVCSFYAVFAGPGSVGESAVGG